MDDEHAWIADAVNETDPYEALQDALSSIKYFLEHQPGLSAVQIALLKSAAKAVKSVGESR